MSARPPAITSAIALGVLIEWLVGRPPSIEDTLPEVAAATVVCALVSAICGGYAASWAVGGRNAYVLTTVGALIVIPDLVGVAAFALPGVLLALPVAAASSGLLLGGRVWSFVNQHQGAP